MFPKEIRSLLTHGTPCVLPWADLYMRSFDLKFIYSEMKSSRTITRTAGIVNLLLILKNASHFKKVGDVSGFTKTADVFEVTVESVARAVSRVFDPAQSGIPTRNFFVKSSAPFTEVLYLSNLVDPLSRLPETLSYYQGWRDIKPLRLVEMSDMPLTLDVSAQQLTFTNAPEGYGVFALDPSALIMKYLAYRKEFQIEGEYEDTTMVRYLVDTVLAPCLLPDSFALWMRNLYRTHVTNGLADYTPMDSYWPTSSNTVVGAGYDNFVRQLDQVKDGLTNKTLHADRVYWSLPVSPDNTPLASWILDLLETTPLPQQYQYQWIEGLAYFGWLELLILIARQGGKSSRYVNFIRTIWHDLNSWCNNHPWSMVKDASIQETVRLRVTGLLAIINADLKDT